MFCSHIVATLSVSVSLKIYLPFLLNFLILAASAQPLKVFNSAPRAAATTTVTTSATPAVTKSSTVPVVTKAKVKAAAASAGGAAVGSMTDGAKQSFAHKGTSSSSASAVHVGKFLHFLISAQNHYQLVCERFHCLLWMVDFLAKIRIFILFLYCNVLFCSRCCGVSCEHQRKLCHLLRAGCSTSPGAW